MSEKRFIGLMSGTSMDGVDAVLVEFGDQKLEVLQTLSQPYEDSLHQQLSRLIENPDAAGLNIYGDLHIRVARQFAAVTQKLLGSAGISADTVTAIGSHGQTVLHSPSSAHPFSLQLGDPGTLAALTGISVVADFRNSDMALGGQGAPLAPGFHRWLAGEVGTDCAVINIGGIANITILSADGKVTGFDTGPGNTLLDSWCQKHLNKPFDDQGAWAGTGTVDQNLLSRMRSDPYFGQPEPKSTGTDYFNLQWIQKQIGDAQESSRNNSGNTKTFAQDVQATLSELTAAEISRGIASGNNLTPNLSQVRLCGGGARNSDLLQRLCRLSPDCTFDTTDAWGVPPEWIEAVAFAWLAKQRLDGCPTNLPEVTGANSSIPLGGLYLPACAANRSE